MSVLCHERTQSGTTTQKGERAGHIRTLGCGLDDRGIENCPAMGAALNRRRPHILGF
jgi:hypothetical protein